MTETAVSLNGSSKVTPDEQAKIDSWPTAAKLSQMTGTSVRGLTRLREAGLLKRYVATDGSMRYDPEQAAEAIGLDSVVQAEASTTKHVLDGSSDVLKQALALLQQAQAHIDRLQAPAQLALELLQNENRRLSDAASEHHRLHLELVRAKEESLTEAHIRKLESTRLELSEKRKGEVFSSIAKVAPKLLAQLQGSPVAAPVDSQSQQVEATIRLLTRLSREQLEGLMVSGFVDEEQAGDIRIILGHAPTTVPPAGEPDGD